MPGALVDVLEPGSQAQPLEGAILELIHIQQAEAVFRDVQQARARAQHVVFGHFGIDIGVAANHAPFGREVAGNVEVETTAAHLTGRNAEGRINRVGGQHVTFFDLVDGRVNTQLLIQRFPLDTHFVRLALLRRKPAALTACAGVGFKGARSVGIDRQCLGQVVGHADARGHRVVTGLPTLAARHEGFVVMFETFETRPGQHLQFVGQCHLILHERCIRLEVFLVMSRRASQRRTRLAVHRVEDVDRVRADRTAGALNNRLVVVIFVLDTGEQRVLQTSGIEMAGQIELGVLIGPLQLAIVEVAPQGAAVSGNTVGLDRVALERSVEPLETAAQRPVVVEHVFETQLRHIVVVMQFANVFFAEKAVAGGGANLFGVTRNASIQRRVVAHEVAFENELGRIGCLPRQHRSDTVAFGFDVIAEGVAALAHYVQSIGQAPLFVERAGSVQRAAFHALIVELTAQGDGALGQRLFGNHVEGAARITPAVEHGGRAAQHFESLDGVGIRHVRIATVDRKTVAIKLASGEASNGKRGQALPTKIVRPPHAPGVVQRVLQTGGAQILDCILRDHTDRLRGFMDRRVGTRGAGRARRPITLHRAVRPLVIRSTDNIGCVQLKR